MPVQFAGNEYQLVNNHYHTVPQLPKGVYNINFRPFMGFYLKKQGDKFELPSKLYGDFKDVFYWKKYVATSNTNTGIFLCGYKGTGKTIEAKKFCNEADRPVVIINHNFGDQNHNLINFLSRPELRGCIIFIDEFEKHFGGGDSEIFLGLMDGTHETNLIFMLTANKENISEYLKNRLGRIRYKKVYDSLDIDVMNKVLDDMLEDQKFRASIETLFHMLGICTFDLLTNIIKEVNIFREDALTCAKRLNLKTEYPTLKGTIYINETKTEIKTDQQEYNLSEIYSAPSKASGEPPHREECYISYSYKMNEFRSFLTSLEIKCNRLFNKTINNQRGDEVKIDEIQLTSETQLKHPSDSKPESNPTNKVSSLQEEMETIKGKLNDIIPNSFFLENIPEYRVEEIVEKYEFNVNKAVEDTKRLAIEVIEDLASFDKNSVLSYYKGDIPQLVAICALLGTTRSWLDELSLAAILGTDSPVFEHKKALEILRPSYKTLNIFNESVSTFKSRSTKILLYDNEKLNVDLVLEPK